MEVLSHGFLSLLGKGKTLERTDRQLPVPILQARGYTAGKPADTK
jgi:hypothetical protein